MPRTRAGAAGARSTAGGKAPARRARKPAPTPEHERHRRIAEAAYYLAERRGFRGGDPVQDWLVAEAQIDQGGDSSPGRKC